MRRLLFCIAICLMVGGFGFAGYKYFERQAMVTKAMGRAQDRARAPWNPEHGYRVTEVSIPGYDEIYSRTVRTSLICGAMGVAVAVGLLLTGRTTSNGHSTESPNDSPNRTA